MDPSGPVMFLTLLKTMIKTVGFLVYNGAVMNRIFKHVQIPPFMIRVLTNLSTGGEMIFLV
jgi:hypothetical protein